MRCPAIPAAAFALVLAVNACSAQASTTDGDGIAAWREGSYERAITALAAAASRPDAQWQMRRAHVHVLLEVSRHDDALDAASTYAAADVRDSALLGDVGASRGALQLAERGYIAALAASTPDSVRVLASLGSVLARQGRWEDAHEADARAVRAVDTLQDAEALIAVSAAYARSGRRDPQRFRDALAVLDEALAASPEHPGVQAALSDLFLQKYNAPDARIAASAALEKNPRHPGALLAEARRRRFEQQGGADSLVLRALEVAPASVRALALSALLELDAEDAEGAAREAESALAVDSTDAEALAALAASRLLIGDDEGLTRVRRRAEQRGAAAGRFYALLAEHAARMRRYGQAAQLAAHGALLDPQEWRAHALAGINLMRIGQVDSARATLERAFAGDPYDLWTKNTLDLLDGYDRFEERREGRFVLLLETEEADLIAPYLLDMLSAAYDSLSSRYSYEPEGVIRLELYRSHADFSVRTVGLAGLGALGVSFGDVLAMDSPAARRPGEFHYGSTAWHELAHTFTLGLSRGKVPRWLSEGISVYEERRARPGWGARPDPALLAAYASGTLPPPSRLGEVFANPGTAERLGQAYVLSSLVAEYVAAVHGDRALPAFVRAFADGVEQEEAVREALGLTSADLDARFEQWMSERYEELLNDDPRAAPQKLLAERERGASLLEAGRPREALEPLQRAVDMLPDYGGHDAPRILLARARLALGDTAGAVSVLAEHNARSETDLQSNLLEADLRQALGDISGATAALGRAVWLMPYDPQMHERLAQSARAAGAHEIEARERRALVALQPSDLAGAYYELARALADAGDRAAARTEVLRALEIAPNFARAQDLLLELRAAERTPRDEP